MLLFVPFPLALHSLADEVGCLMSNHSICAGKLCEHLTVAFWAHVLFGHSEVIAVWCKTAEHVRGSVRDSFCESTLKSMSDLVEEAVHPER